MREMADIRKDKTNNMNESLSMINEVKEDNIKVRKVMRDKE